VEESNGRGREEFQPKVGINVAMVEWDLLFVDVHL